MAMLKSHILAMRSACVSYSQMFDLYTQMPPGLLDDPESQQFAEGFQRWIEHLLHVDLIHGGWMENRTHLLSSVEYLRKKDTFLHLGVDVSVHAGTEILAPSSGRVLHTGTDVPCEGGWGGHVVQLIEFQGQQCTLIAAHLGPILVRPGDEVQKGAVLGIVGTKEENGGWGEHLHVQLCRHRTAKDNWQKLMADDTLLDGYGKVSAIHYLSLIHPDPTLLIFS